MEHPLLRKILDPPLQVLCHCKYYAIAWQGKTFKKRKRKRNSKQPGILGASFRLVLKSTMITWGTRDLWIVGNFLSLYVISDATLLFPNPQAIHQYNTQSPDYFEGWRSLQPINWGSWERQIIGVICTVASFYYYD